MKQPLQFIFTARRITPVVGCMLLSLAAAAQQDTVKKLKDVTVSSTPLPKVKTITPQQQVTAEDFKRYSAFNVADVVRNLAGVNIRDYGGIGGLKTISVRSLGANHTAVLHDGVQMNDAVNGQIDLSKLNVQNLQEVTLYNGQPGELCLPARAYASASILAVKTLRPLLTVDKPYNLMAGFKTGSFGLINPYLQYQQRINNRWSAVVNANWQKASGRYQFKVDGDASDTLAVRRNADINSFQGEANVYWAKSDSNKLYIKANGYHAEQGLPGPFIFYTANSSQRMWTDDAFLQAGYERTYASSLHLLLNTKLAYDKQRYLDPNYLNAAGKLDQRYTQSEIYQSAALSYKLLSNWEISYAIDGSLNHLNTNLYQYAYPTRFTLLNAVATNVHLGKLTLQGSLLNTYIAESVDEGSAAPSKNVFTPSAMATFQPFVNPALQVRAFYKNIFRNPTFNDLYYTRVGNRNLKPEFADQYDLGVTYAKPISGFIDYVTFTADGYFNRVKDKIIAIPGKDPYSWTIFNQGKVDITGADAGFKTQTRNLGNVRFSLSANYTYQHAIDADYNSPTYLDQIAYTPLHTLTANFGVDTKKISLYYNQVLSSSRYYSGDNQPENKVSGYNIGDVSAAYRTQVYGRAISLLAEINNVFNKSYAVIKAFPMPGRSYRFTFQITI